MKRMRQQAYGMDTSGHRRFVAAPDAVEFDAC